VHLHGTQEVLERHLKLVHNVKDSLIMTLMFGALILCENKEMVPYKCKECEFYCATKEDLEKHFEAFHVVLKYYDCSQCLFAATSLHRLATHVKTRH